MASHRRHTGRGGWSPGRPRLVHDPVQLSIKVERPVMDWLKKTAAGRGLSMAQLVRELLRARALEGGA